MAHPTPSEPGADEDDIPVLPPDSLAMVDEILYPEKSIHDPTNPYSMDRFSEDWNASQFWYTDHTSIKLAKAALQGTWPGMRIAIMSAPSVYVNIKRMLTEAPAAKRPLIKLFEFDRGFNVYEDFVYYDYNEIRGIPEGLHHTFDVLVIDPPFLSEECQMKTAEIACLLARNQPLVRDGNDVGMPKVLLATGERMKELVLHIYRAFEIKRTDFTPEHGSGLANPFACYANFPCGFWLFESEAPVKGIEERMKESMQVTNR